jgi:KDO2-lipid IV(A) lauroyltransferase
LSKRTPLRNAAEYAVAAAVVSSLRWLPLPLAHPLSRFCARLLDRMAPRLRRIARINLKLALPERAAQHEAIIDGVFRGMARLLVAFAKLPDITRANVHEWIRYDGFEHYEAAKRQGHGVLFATGHLGNWELSAHAHALLTEPMHVVVRPLDNPLIDALVAARRSRAGNRVIEKKDFARGILAALKANEPVGILVDQNSMAEQGIFVDFFGIPACTAPVFAKLAARAGTTIIPGFALWSETESRYVLKFYPPVELSGDAALDTQRVQSAVERAIREYPDQWLWIHRRWKTRPPGAPDIY